MIATAAITLWQRPEIVGNSVLHVNSASASYANAVFALSPNRLRTLNPTSRWR